MQRVSKVWFEYDPILESPLISNHSDADPKRDNWASIKEKKKISAWVGLKSLLLCGLKNSNLGLF